MSFQTSTPVLMSSGLLDKFKQVTGISEPKKQPNMPSAAELRDEASKPNDPSVPQTYEIRDRQQEEQPTSTDRPKEATNAPTNED